MGVEQVFGAARNRVSPHFLSRNLSTGSIHRQGRGVGAGQTGQERTPPVEEIAPVYVYTPQQNIFPKVRSII